jgi:hypothetical protein
MTQYRLFGGFMRPRDPDEDINGCDPCIAKPIESTRITYDGPNLPCTGILTCDTLTVALQKLDQQICKLQSDMYDLTILVRNLSTTTTTTTTTQLP